MGYTHYWTFQQTKDKAATSEKKYQQAIKECQRVILAIASENKYFYGSSCLSGYSAHTKVGQYGGLEVNGKGSDACETFVMREHYNQNDRSGFCKTNRGHYDFAVVACLAILQYRLGNNIVVSSDGDEEDWIEAVELASKILRRKITVPAGVRPVNSKRSA